MRQGAAHRFSAVEADDGQVAGYGQAAGARPLEDFGGGQVVGGEDSVNGSLGARLVEAALHEHEALRIGVSKGTVTIRGLSPARSTSAR